MSDRIKNAGVILAKLGMALAVIAAIAGIMGGVGTDGEMQGTQADITALDFAPRPKVERFTNSLRALGHSEPQVYELNGNRIFFSVRKTGESPATLLREYQDEFVRQHLNEQPFYEMKLDKMMQRKRTSLTGGVVPMVLSRDHIIMGGVETRGDPQTPSELLAAHSSAKGPAELFDAYRWVEIFRQKNQPLTTVIATWSDDGFDYDEMFPRPFERQTKGVDPRVPVCTGCLKVNQFADLGKQGTHQSYVFVTDESIEQARHFYESTLEAQGWTARENARVFDRLKGRVQFDYSEIAQLDFVRDEALLELRLFPMDDHQTGIRVILMDQAFLDAERNDKP